MCRIKAGNSIVARESAIIYRYPYRVLKSIRTNITYVYLRLRNGKTFWIGSIKPEANNTVARCFDIEANKVIITRLEEIFVPAQKRRYA